MKRIVIQRALDSFCANRNSAEWKLELHTTGKLVGGQHIRAVATALEMDQLLSEVIYYNGLVQNLERKLDLEAL